jgi:proteasome lid subunit RPN8/RPN11
MLAVPEALIVRLRAHAAACYPRECCGFLIGRIERAELVVTDMSLLPNAASAPDRFLMPPENMLEAVRTTWSQDLDLLAIYHSHCDGEAFPSEADRREAIPGLIHVILSIREAGGGDLRAWRLEPDRSFEPVRVTRGAA